MLETNTLLGLSWACGTFPRGLIAMQEFCRKRLPISGFPGGHSVRGPRVQVTAASPCRSAKIPPRASLRRHPLSRLAGLAAWRADPPHKVLENAAQSRQEPARVTAVVDGKPVGFGRTASRLQRLAGAAEPSFRRLIAAAGDRRRARRWRGPQAAPSQRNGRPSASPSSGEYSWTSARPASAADAAFRAETRRRPSAP